MKFFIILIKLIKSKFVSILKFLTFIYFFMSLVIFYIPFQSNWFREILICELKQNFNPNSF